MLPAERRTWVTVAIGIAAILVLPLIGQASGSFAAITGSVRDSAGIPVVGALVIVAASNPSMPERMAFTDKRGGFSIPNLFAGEYSVKVTMPRFLPATKSGIQINAGGNAILTVNLQNAWDVVRRAVSRDKAQSDDMLWTMRSSRSTQPPIHLVDTDAKRPANVQPQDYTGYVQVYSKSVETSSGVEEGVGSQFSVTMPLDNHSRVILAGLYSELPTQPRGFGAKYQFTPADRHRAAIGLNVRQGSLVGDAISVGMREIQLEYGEDFQWSDHLVLNYGAEVGRADAISDQNYLRPRLAVSWVPENKTTLTVGATSQAPSSPDDPIRGKDYFDRAAYIPPALERYAHTEVAMSRVLSESTDFTAAYFQDRTETQALFVSSPEGRRGVLFLDSSQFPASGVRLHMNRVFSGFQAGLGYTMTTGLAIDGSKSGYFRDVQNHLIRDRFHIVSARFKADVDTTQTEVTAVYRWMSAFSASRLDPYQQTIEFNDPSLSLTVAQNLPTWRVLPGKVQAILDARNLFEHSYGSKATQVSQYPRLVKGGISIKF